MEKDLIVIGGGPGGYTAAIRGAQLGARVTLIEKDLLGGTCLNRGCIPTKTLHRSAELMHHFKNAAEFGLKADTPVLDGVAVHDRCVQISTQLRGGIEQLIKANGIELLNGTGEFLNDHEVKVTLSDGTTETRTGKNIIIATGSSPFIPPIPGIHESGVLNSDELLGSTEIPESMVIIGGGVIGVEFASIYAAFGTKVTIIEMLPTILSTLDTDITKRFTASLKKKGIELHVSTKVIEIEKGIQLKVTAEGPKGALTVEAEKVLVAIGRKAEVQGLNLEAAGVHFSMKGIPVDENNRTNFPHIYSIGDVNGGIMLAHWAAHQGMEAAEHAVHEKSGLGNSPVPGCIFSFPEIATAGLTEDEAKTRYGNIKISKFMFGASGKALAMGEGEGFMKVVAKEDGTLVGVHIMGPHASDLIHEGVLAISKEMRAEEIGHIIHAHPTLGETFYEAVTGLDGLAIHLAPTKRKS